MPNCLCLQLVKGIQAKRLICLQKWCMLSTWPCCKAGRDSLHIRWLGMAFTCMVCQDYIAAVGC